MITMENDESLRVKRERERKRERKSAWVCNRKDCECYGGRKEKEREFLCYSHHMCEPRTSARVAMNNRMRHT